MHIGDTHTRTHISLNMFLKSLTVYMYMYDMFQPILGLDSSAALG